MLQVHRIPLVVSYQILIAETGFIFYLKNVAPAGSGRRYLGVLWCGRLCSAAPGPSLSFSMEGVSGGRAAQIYGVVACSRWVAAWAVMARCWVTVLEAYLV